MYVLYEEDGSFKGGRILSEADSSLQVEAASGKRSKIKRNNVVMEFAAPDPDSLLTQAQSAAEAIDLDFLWECAPQEEFDVAALAQDYFGHAPSALDQATLLLRLHSAPAYFHRRGKGRYRPAPPDILQAALAAIEKKRLQAEQQQAWTDAMTTGTLPPEIAEVAPSLLLRPDKNSLQWKALDAACQQTGKTPDQLLLQLGAWPHPLALMRFRFLAQQFPKGTGFAEVTMPELPDTLPEADVEAYSVDDVSTTEIDDALSVSVLPDGNIRVGVHIAAPALAVTRGSTLDEIARQRMSTVYMPGQKIPMQPPGLIEAFSLDAGRPVPALSLYVTANPETGDILETTTRLERIQVRENLRHNHLDADITPERLAAEDPTLPYAHWLLPLWKLALALSRKRDEIRGKPEGNNRVEYSFELDGPADDPDTPVNLVPRRRDAPLDRMVAEYMILANSQWGALLDQHGVPGIYRSQQMGRVRMSTQALPHEAIGVKQYIWSTSPLRRYVDLVNQQQLLAAAEHGISARLVAPYKPRDADLYALISAFDGQYTAISDFQRTMERYWCLRWLKQQNITRCRASFIRDNLARLEIAPLVVEINGMPELARGQQIEIEILGQDEINLTLDCRYLEAIPQES
ncbi:ribonuclease catalytic domain-containing protein [Corticimicrobacter populi]|uniref:Ribonuclease II n=1 Tax=Corticimicrobacter populi TaxID=2175229 RepID=A0A2V1JY49_9BURK|nr:RNB domain-containing ribonuclease [Corticimicrobacter populi]PWF22267.1 ribonuclease II [Corticimicrobacter populi]